MSIMNSYGVWNMWQNILESASKWFDCKSSISLNKDSFTCVFYVAIKQRNWTISNLSEMPEKKPVQSVASYFTLC